MLKLADEECKARLKEDQIINIEVGEEDPDLATQRKSSERRAVKGKKGKEKGKGKGNKVAC